MEPIKGMLNPVVWCGSFGTTVRDYGDYDDDNDSDHGTVTYTSLYMCAWQAAFPAGQHLSLHTQRRGFPAAKHAHTYRTGAEL